jgi:pimeloyl-ACP methyl ester carboxylesterase
MNWKPLLSQARKPWGVSLCAGVLGAVVLGARYALRPAAKTRVPEMFPPAIFATRVFYSSRGQIVYHESGQGEPLIFLHGFYVGASSYEWSKVYPYFAQAHQVLAIDQLGFGESERPDRALSAGDYIRSLVEIIEMKCGGERATIVASGLGAAFATALAAQHPDLVRRLFLLAPTGLIEFGRQRLPRRYRVLSRFPVVNRLFYRRYLATRIQIRAWLTSVGFADSSKISDETVDALTSSAQRFGAERAVFNWLSRRLNLDLEKRLAEVPQPITLLWGDKTRFPPLEWAYRLQPVAKQCNLIVLKEVGLLAPLEAPDELKEVLAHELDSSIRLWKYE